MTGIETNNLRQQFLPFVIDPSADINAKDQNDSSSAQPQIFSFRKKDLANKKSRGIINIFPTDRGQFNMDAATSLLVSKALEDYKTPHGLTSLDTILNYTPGVQIREFTQHTRLEEIMTLVKAAVEGFKEGVGLAGGISAMSNKDKALLAYKGAYIAKYVRSDAFIKDLADSITSDISIENYPYDKDKSLYAIKFVHALYYRMVGSLTTNIYNIPNVQTQYMVSNGASGWPTPNGVGVGDSAHSWLGKFIKFAGGNIKIVTEPVWNAEFGGDGTSIDINLSLFNDTYEHAINNFLFVNTIVPQNMFLQYGLWQMPPSAYDIKIEGGMRYWMCKGSMTCNYKGVVRTPTKKMVDELVNKHLNNKNETITKSITSDFLVDKHIIKIPDVYELSLKFTSMLPDSFNQYLMTFAMNNNIVEIKSAGNNSWGSGFQKPMTNLVNRVEKITATEAGVGDKTTIDDAIKFGENAAYTQASVDESGI